MNAAMQACAGCGTTWGMRPGMRYCLDCHVEADSRRNGLHVFPLEWDREEASSPVVVPVTPKGRDHHHNISPDRYVGRRVDVLEMLSRPPQPIP